MAEIKQASKAKLFFGIMYKNMGNFQKIKKILIEHFGDMETESHEYNFNFTEHYKEELGANLKKEFLVFKRLISRNQLVKIRLLAQELEKQFTINNNRTINIDPGYITKHQLILATAKEMPCRIHLNRGIFAHLVYTFNKHGCILAEKTFPDFKTEQIQNFFFEIRNKLP